MVEKKLIQDTINELLDANVDKESIYSTLKDIGVDEGEIKENYDEVIASREKGESSKEEAPKKEPKQEEKETQDSKPKEDDSQKETKPEDEPKEENEESEEEEKPKEQSTKDLDTANLEKEDKHEKELKDTSNDVNKLNEDYDKEEFSLSGTSPKTESKEETKGTSPEETKDIQEQLAELKAQVSALTKITKDVLQTNRDILNKL